MSAKDILRSLVPQPLLQWNRNRKKAKVRKDLEARKAAGDVWTKASLVESLKAAGVAPGKDLLVHSAMSSIGYVGQGLEEIFVNQTEISFSLVAQPEYLIPIGTIASLVILIILFKKRLKN